MHQGRGLLDVLEPAEELAVANVGGADHQLQGDSAVPGEAAQDGKPVPPPAAVAAAAVADDDDDEIDSVDTPARYL
ncbi:hypothetical protein HK405_001841, partial [Cladochytrium tenue]